MVGEVHRQIDIGGLRSRIEPIVTEALTRSFELGFLGSMPIDGQIDHALGFVAILEEIHHGPPNSVIDLGTGGGVPGLVLISCWPTSRVVLIDANERRTLFLEETLAAWPTSANAEVVRGRAEELGRDEGLRERFDAVTSRSFGIPSLTAECGSSFLCGGGQLVVSEPPDSTTKDRWPEEGLQLVSLVQAESVRSSVGFGYQILTKTSPIEDRYPRRVGIPAKRPLF